MQYRVGALVRASSVASRRLVALGLVVGLTACGSDPEDASSGDGSGGDPMSASGGAGASDGAGGDVTNGTGGNPVGAGGATTGGGTGGSVGGGGDSGGTDGGAPSSRAACKRGVAYGHHSAADMAALSPGVSWWYNWAFEPDTGIDTATRTSLDVDYVPMIWGAASDRERARTDIPASASVLLGFNEPNFGEQANLSAAEAASLWPEVETIADARGLRLVSPAVNFCGGDCQDTDPFGYLDDFLAACDGCRVDAIGIHIYVGCNPDGDNHAQWLINHVETYKERFDHPLWLTEFACDDASTDEEQLNFMVDALEYLETEPRIEKYAWFAGRADNVPRVDLLGADGELTALGQAYVNAPQACDE